MLTPTFPPSGIPSGSNEPVATKPDEGAPVTPGFSGWIRHKVSKLAGFFAGVSWGEAVRFASVRLADRTVRIEKDPDDEFYDASSSLENLIPGNRSPLSSPAINPQQREQRQRRKQQIMEAFQEGELHCRGVNLTPRERARGLELNYQWDKVEPRPAICLKQGVPVKLFDMAELHLGLLPVKELFSFKKDIGSDYFKESAHTEFSRQLLPNREALLDKMEEHSACQASLYRPCSSGRLMPHGRHQSGHHNKAITPSCLPLNESIIEGYRKQHYQCVIINVPFTLESLCQQLHKKARLEKAMGIEALPLAFYHVESGTIEEILYLDDHGITPETLPELASNIDRLIKFKSACCCPDLDDVLSRLPPSRLLAQLMALPEQVLRISAKTTDLEITALVAVRNNDLGILKRCHERGANLNAMYEIEGRYMNLLGFLTHMDESSDPDIMARRHDLGKFLYQQGCRVLVTDSVFEKFPKLSVFMLDQGEMYRKGTCPSLAVSTLLNKWAEGGITESEFRTGLDAFKKEYSYDELALNYSYYIGQELSSYAEQERDFYRRRKYPEYLKRSNINEHTLKETKKKLSMIIARMASTGLHVNPELVGKVLLYFCPAAGFALDNDQQPDPALPYEEKIKQFVNETLDTLKRIQATDPEQAARQSLIKAMSDPGPTQLDHRHAVPPEFLWLQQLIQLPPDTANKSYHQLARLAVRHYYQTPHPSQLEKMILCKPEQPEPLRPFHAEDHIARCQVLAEGIMPLFAEHDARFQTLFQNHPGLHELVPLAMVYHDVVAEVEDKEQEESRAADLFERDMIASGQYPASLVTLVANALRNKSTNTMAPVKPPYISDQSCPEEERLVRHLVRLPDNLDLIRVMPVPPDWTTPYPAGSWKFGFDIRKLDIPDNLKANTTFMNHFEALMEGAKALAYTTGGAPPNDLSDSGSYLKRHHLVKNNDTRRYKVSRAVYAYDSVIEALDDNVRRAIAKQAGLHTCQADHSRTRVKFENRQAECLSTDPEGREFLTAIHDEQELRQVRLPAGMTVQEKLMFEKQGPDCLPEDKRKQVEREVARLRHSGIQPPLGTLTQETLADERAKATLKKHYGIDVVPEDRFCGYNDDGSGKTVRLLVPRRKKENPT